MKTILTFRLLLCLQLSVAAQTDELLMLRWDSEIQDVLQWEIMKEQQDGSYKSVAVVPVAAGPVYDYRLLPEGSHVIKIKTVMKPANAISDSIEVTSEEFIRITIPASAKNLRIALQISTDLKTWTTVAEYEATEPRTFARAAIVSP